MIDVHVKYPGATAPSEGTYYIVARNGLHMRMYSDWVDAVIPLKELQALECEKPRAKVLLPPINADIFLQIYAFFRNIYLTHQTEAAVLLHYSREHGWAFTVPGQQVSRSQVKYEMTQRLEGYRCVGTMHSHADMRAGHSNTDIHDEAAFDGIHVTLGSLNEHPHFSMEAETVLRGQRFPLPIEHIGGVVAPPQVPPEERFLKGTYRSSLYTLAENEFLNDFVVPKEWMQQVQLPAWAWYRPVKNVESVPVPDASTLPVQKEVFLLEDNVQHWNSPDRECLARTQRVLPEYQDTPPEGVPIVSVAFHSKPPVAKTAVVSAALEKDPPVPESLLTSLIRLFFPTWGTPKTKENEEKK